MVSFAINERYRSRDPSWDTHVICRKTPPIQNLPICWRSQGGPTSLRMSKHVLSNLIKTAYRKRNIADAYTALAHRDMDSLLEFAF